MKAKGRMVYIVDENIMPRDIARTGEFIFFPKGTLDEGIISVINTIGNPVCFLTRNPRDFRGKLKDGDKVIPLQGDPTSEQLMALLPKVKQKISANTGLKNCELIIRCSTTDSPVLVAT